MMFRFIPACAGNASTERLAESVYCGSSPHARGTLSWKQGNLSVFRFIPACAGNARRERGLRLGEPVHPRMRGERLAAVTCWALQNGSSPHARGTLQTVRICPAENRFIPACAGNANYRRSGGRHSAVHPRMRGERTAADILLHRFDGSSPHARGTHDRLWPTRVHGRFIPACAGNAATTTRGVRLPPVHPRMRGERMDITGRPCASSGSSPHARGTRTVCRY